MSRHVHCYPEYPGIIEGCVYDQHGKPLATDEAITYEGREYKPLLDFDCNDVLVVQTDISGAQIATPSPSDPASPEREAKQLVGAGAGFGEMEH